MQRRVFRPAYGVFLHHGVPRFVNGAPSTEMALDTR
jgi:hypothetical protein